MTGRVPTGRSGHAGKRAGRPRLAVWKFASCDGCQLTLLDCEDELLALAADVEIAYFLEASSAPGRGPYDLSLVEGSVTTPDDLQRIKHVRRVSKRLVTIGACATAGGIQALRDFADVQEFLSIVYARPDYIATLDRSTPISAHVPVDFELRGCPIDKRQLLEVISAFLAGRRPGVPSHSVCVECKAAGNVCVMVAHGTPCLGPVTQAGCGALCPAFDRGCYGCFGPMQSPNARSLNRRLQELGMSTPELVRVYRTFNATEEPFRQAAERAHEAGDERDAQDDPAQRPVTRGGRGRAAGPRPRRPRH
ncbi:oxidoreductase [Sphaerisporangium sp. B11E5]|uniref:NADH-quinone oxidoreductase subunit B family protein n=1 Tax=Sphaerisporangium sp. B11E5 TaxID=3153563 RepID=UPI00325E78ED